ncbi:MAG: Ig-like domain-containing protein, partial [Patescibacteria group bacterium]|nr:Ig-like domain-containing protein [Patescibacteria group bacterium]
MFIFKKQKLIFVIVIISIAFFACANFVFAQNFGMDYASTLGLGTQGLKTTLTKIVKTVLGFLGIIAIIVILYGGFIWMTSGGRPERVDKAKKILINGAIGLTIILLSFAIIQFIIFTVTGGKPTAPGDNSNGNGALGAGIIENVYPAPGQRDVARNTKIAVTFKESMNPESFIFDANGNGILGDYTDTNGNGILDAGDIYDTIAVDNLGNPNIKIAKRGELASGPLITEVFVSKTIDNKIFVFKSIELLGNPTDNTWYSAELTNNLEKANNDPAFGALGGFIWSFEIGTFVDLTPPYVKSILPSAGGTYAKNVVIQIHFSEAIDPTSIIDTNIIVSGNITAPVAGTLYISNQYRTVEFLGSACGINSCGDIIYCLPGSENITVNILAAALSGEPPMAMGPPYNGIVDMVGNSLDGNHNNLAEGPPVDNYSWNFNTTNEIELTEPTIISISPNIGDIGTTLRDPLDVLFSEIMMYSSLRSNNIKIVAPVVDYWITAENQPPVLPFQTRAFINHSRFNTATDYTSEV